MLKIKDNVDLKELEKFGFVYVKNDFNGYKAYQLGELFDQFMCVKPNERILEIYTSDDCGVNENVLYDLIKADLVEKVSDGNE